MRGRTRQAGVDVMAGKQGNLEIEALFRERYSEMVGLAGLLLNDRHTAEEVVQDAFAKFHLARQRILDPDRQVSYLRSIVCNLARGRLRRWGVERRRPPVPQPQAAPPPRPAASRPPRGRRAALRAPPARRGDPRDAGGRPGLGEAPPPPGAARARAPPGGPPM